MTSHVQRSADSGSPNQATEAARPAHSYDEFSPLVEVVVGTARAAYLPDPHRDRSAWLAALEQRGVDVLPHTLRHARALGGGLHCVTVDTVRHGPARATSTDRPADARPRPWS